MDQDDARRIELRGAIALMIAAAAAMLFANSPWSELYDQLVLTHLEVRVGEASLDKPILLWINDGLMAIFFLLVGLELKREVLEGELSDPARIWLPLAAAVGGIAVPTLIYTLVCFDDPLALEGWAIPAATDIAFAIGVLALLGKRVPASLRIFLLSLAVFDDVAAIVIIAAFYTEKISWIAKGFALGVTAVLILLNRLRVTRYGVYLLVGVVLWVLVLKSGVHATLAGVVVGLAVPRRPKNELGHPPLHQLELVLRPWVAYVVLPAFAFANAGVTLGGASAAALVDPVSVGIALGLVVGKPVGVLGASFLVVRSGLAQWPDGARGAHLVGVALLAGIGLTMSLLIGTLAFEDAPDVYGARIRVGVLAGSVVAAIGGYALLRARF